MYKGYHGLITETPCLQKRAGFLCFSKLEIIFCAFLAENNFVNLLIPFIGVRERRL